MQSATDVSLSAQLTAEDLLPVTPCMGCAASSLTGSVHGLCMFLRMYRVIGACAMLLNHLSADLSRPCELLFTGHLALTPT